MSGGGRSTEGGHPGRHGAEGEELRAAVRILVQLETSLRGLGDGFSVSHTVNVSLTGALLASRRPPSVGSELRFGLLLPDDPLPIRGRCIVVRHSDRQREGVAGMAVRFVDFVDQDDARLAQLLDDHLAAGARGDAH